LFDLTEISTNRIIKSTKNVPRTTIEKQDISPQESSPLVQFTANNSPQSIHHKKFTAVNSPQTSSAQNQFTAKNKILNNFSLLSTQKGGFKKMHSPHRILFTAILNVERLRNS
jgi:hypothetical protein